MTKRKLCMSDDLSTQYELNYGVPQGSILGPLLFIAYTYDMSYFCSETDKIVYADDTTVIVNGRNLKEAKDKANDVLTQFYEYFTVNKLSINESKTNYMIYDFRNKTNKNKDDNETQLYMNGVKLNEVKKIRFLGVIINNQLTWTDHKMHIKSKICKALGIIYSSREILRHSHLINIYNTFIQPYFNYCITLWGSSIASENDPLVKLQNKVLRILFSCKRSEDAWEMDRNQKILKIRHLYLQEIAKLCFKHHLDLNPSIINSIMPEKYKKKLKLKI